MTHRCVTNLVRILAGLLCILRAAPAWAEDTGLRALHLQAGTSYRGELDLSVEPSKYFAIVVPENAYAVRVSVTDAAADVDIAMEDSEGELYALSERELYNETLFLTRIGDPPLLPGEYYVSVIYQYADPPVIGGRAGTVIPFRLSYEVVEAVPQAELILGVPQRGVLRPEDGMIAIYKVEVGEGVRELRLDVFDPAGDVDLFVNHGSVSVDPLRSDHLAQSYLGRESLVIGTASHPPLQAGTYYVTVLDQIEDESSGEFSLVASTEGVPPLLLDSLPVVPTPATTMDRVLSATVQIITENGGGSGCVVSPSGHLLTSWHVVRDNAGMPAQSAVVAVSLNYEQPPVELYRARVLRYSVERDIALLLIESGLYAQPLPSPLELPYLELGDPSRLQFGDPLWLVGYPDVGGTGSRVSITLTRGVVSGFERRNFGRVIKTDGEINEGNSGGAALNEAFELVGLPTRVVGQDAGQIAYIHPVSLIPDSWRRIIGQ